MICRAANCVDVNRSAQLHSLRTQYTAVYPCLLMTRLRHDQLSVDILLKFNPLKARGVNWLYFAIQV